MLRIIKTSMIRSALFCLLRFYFIRKSRNVDNIHKLLYFRNLSEKNTLFKPPRIEYFNNYCHLHVILFFTKKNFCISSAQRDKTINRPLTYHFPTITSYFLSLTYRVNARFSVPQHKIVAVEIFYLYLGTKEKNRHTGHVKIFLTAIADGIYRHFIYIGTVHHVFRHDGGFLLAQRRKAT